MKKTDFGVHTFDGMYVPAFRVAVSVTIRLEPRLHGVRAGQDTIRLRGSINALSVLDSPFIG